MSDLTFSTSDFRSSTQASKRNANRKHKWQLGAAQRVGRADASLRPHRPSETVFNLKRRETKSAVASLAHGTKIARKQDMLEGAATTAISDDSSRSGSDVEEIPSSPAPDAEVMYSFDAARGPSQGGEILNVALANAVKKFEEKETAKLIRDEYQVIDSEGESVGLSPVKKAKGKAKAIDRIAVMEEEDGDYEFV